MLSRLSLEHLKLATKHQAIRRELGEEFINFVAIYLGPYFYDTLKPFHEEIMRACSASEIQNVLIVGFRGSGKSTIANTAFVLWVALTEKFHFVIVISDTSEQAKQSFRNIRIELEENELLIADYGDQRARSRGIESSWQTQKLILANGVQILGRSRGQKIRGLRHGKYRPDCIVIDDPEDAEWVRIKENRDKSERWIRQEVLPAMASGKTKVVVIGNFLHNDALLPRLEKMGIFQKVIKVPLLDDNGINAWPERFTPSVIKQKELEAGFISWNREYLLKVVPDEGQVVKPEDIHYYDQIPEDAKTGIQTHGVDLAISKEASADYTAVVSGITYRYGQSKKAHLCIKPGVVNRKVDFKETIDLLYEMKSRGGVQLFFVEEVGYQKAAIETMKLHQIPVVAVRPVSDKLARLRVAAQFIKDGTVQFPRQGSEILLTQLYGFGSEQHDDMCFSADTLILTDHGEVPIKNVKAGDRVMTRQGYKRVLAGGITGFKETITRLGLTATSDHPIITTHGVIPLQYTNVSDTIFVWNREKLCTEERHIDANLILNGAITASTTGGTINGNHPLLRFIGKSTSTPTDRSKKDTTCIMSTATRSTMPSAISKRNLEANISANICERRSDERNPAAQSSTPSWQLPNGIALMPEGSGIRNMPASNGRILKSTIASVRNVKNTSNHFMLMRGDVGIDAINAISGAPILTTTAIVGKQPVYNLTVEGAHEFFANGILVHNCDALVYLILGTVAEGLDLQRVVWLET